VLCNLDISQLSTSYATLASSSDLDENNLASLFALLERYIQLATWDCPNHGYGPDPSDSDDTAGTTCSSSNKKKIWKCKFRFRLHSQFNRICKVSIPFGTY